MQKLKGSKLKAEKRKKKSGFAHGSTNGLTNGGYPWAKGYTSTAASGSAGNATGSTFSERITLELTAFIEDQSAQVYLFY